MLSSIFGSDFPPAAQYAVAFVIIFVLLTVFALILRRLTGGRQTLTSQDRGRTRQPRLGIVDVYELDRQRQLVLLRRDNVEHLLLIGGPNDVVIETNIVRVPGARLPPAPNEPLPERLEPEQAPGRPVIEPPRAGPDNLAARLGIDPTPSRRIGSEAGEAGATQPAPVRPEPALKPDVVAAAPQAAPRGRRPEPMPEAEPARAPAQEPRPARPQFQRSTAAPESRPNAAPPGPEPEARRPEPSARPARSADPGVLSDMAKHLEAALKRPQGSAEAAPEPPRDDHPPRPMPLPAEPSPAPEERATPAKTPPQAAPAGAVEPRPRPAPRPAEAPPARPATPPPPPPPRAQPTPEAAQPSPAPSSAAGVSDPFSVEEIEAEFARLLGRPLDKADKG